MSAPATQTKSAPANRGAGNVRPGEANRPAAALEPTAAVRAWRRQRVAYRLAAIGCVALGGILLAGNLGLAPVAAAGYLAALGPVALAAVGLLLALGGLRRWAPALPAFAVERDSYTAATLQATTGAADLQVVADAGSTQLALGRFPSHRGPRLEVAGERAWLVLEPRLALPHLPGAWTVALTKALPWALDLRSSAGRFDLQLRDVPVQSLTLRSAFGHVELELPFQVPSTAEIRLGLGDLVVKVPDGLPLRLTVEGGRLATVDVDEQRWPRLGPGEWASPGLAPDDSRPCYTLNVELGTGDIVVS